MLFKKSAKSEEIKSNTDRYLITYADLITLLLGLFVILYATAQVDEGKYKEFSEAFSKYFKPDQIHKSQNGNGILSGSKSLPEPIFQNHSSVTIDDIANETESKLSSFMRKGLIQMKKNSTGLILTLPEKLLFQSAKAEIQPEGKYVIDTLAKILSGIKFQISVDGHTDSDPISTFRFPSNWHLSSSRALNVGYEMIKSGIQESNLRISSYGSQRPISDNTTPEGKSENRRVEITITPLPSNAATESGYSPTDTNTVK